MTSSNQRGANMRGYGIPMPSLNNLNATGGRRGSGNQRGEGMRGYAIPMPSLSLPPMGGTVRGGNRGAQPGASIQVPSRAASLPAGYAYQERMLSRQADNSRIGAGAAPAATLPAATPVIRPAQATSPRPAVTQRPAAITVPGGTIEADYQVPAGSRPMPSQAPALPAARPGTLMAPVGAGRNEQLVQAAGNAGMRLASPEAMAIASAQPMRPMVSNDGARRMLSEFGSARPALVEAQPIEAGFDVGAALSAQTTEAAAAGFQAGVAAAGGDRFAHLRPDIAQWARHHENSAKGVDGMNIVDRFMAKQGAAPPAAPVSFPAQAPAWSPESQPQVATAIQPAAVDPAALQGAFQPNALQGAASVFGSQEVNPVDQVGILREMYRQHTRPQPAPF
jgi:hypothetical protein